MSAAPARVLHAGGRVLGLGDRPRLMGVVNASPDSFSDGGRHASVAEQVELARRLVAAGAELIDVGGESAATDRPAVTAAEEIDRVVPVIERVAHETDALISVDTYKPAVAEAALAAGAAMVNDVSGLRDPRVAQVCARTGAALVLVHTQGAPKQKILDHPYESVAREVAEFLAQQMALARAHGVTAEQLLLDPGPDLGKNPAQTVESLRALEALHELGRPLLLAVSRKDFIGALTGRRPRERLAGTLAALAHGVDAGAHIVRVHDVADAADFLAVRAALAGTAELDANLRLAPGLRREPAPASDSTTGPSITVRHRAE
ncbi:MAG: dihydropteroate synthase [Actinomycetota bacterium]|nr:dihydropteroate synthase [Actinomycetota bacterium]